MTSSARHVFTLRHLVRRKFGANGVEDALIGPQSFPACLSNAIIQVGINWQFKNNLLLQLKVDKSWSLRLILMSPKSVRKNVFTKFTKTIFNSLLLWQCPVLTGIKSVPSVERPSPGKLGYYIGGHTGKIQSRDILGQTSLSFINFKHLFWNHPHYYFIFQNCLNLTLSWKTYKPENI